MKLELKRTEGEAITLFNQGDMFAPTEQEFEHALALIELAIEFADELYPHINGLLYVELNNKEVPATISTVQELIEWYMMEVQ